MKNGTAKAEIKLGERLLKPFKLMKYIEKEELKQLAKIYYPKGLEYPDMSQEQLMVAINSNVKNTKKNPLLVYLNHIHHRLARKNPELEKLLNQLIHLNESIKVTKKAQELLNGKQDKKIKAREGEYVYLIQEDFSKTIKIGYTCNPNRRLTEFKIQLPFEIEHIHTMRCAKGRETEKLLHQHYHKKRVNGEWFRLSEQDVDDIKKLNLPKKIVAMITGENIDSYLNNGNQKKKSEQTFHKKVKNVAMHEPKIQTIFDDNDYLIYEGDYDEFRRDPSIETYDES